MLEPIGANFGQTFGICTGMFTDSQTYNDAQILSLNYQASKIICSLPALVRTFDVNLSLSTYMLLSTSVALSLLTFR